MKVVDDTGAVVEGARVTGNWTLTFKGSPLNTLTVTTTSEGIAKLDSNRVGGANSGDVFSFTVDDVSKNGFI